jgi:aminopeptidase N
MVANVRTRLAVLTLPCLLLGACSASDDGVAATRADQSVTEQSTPSTTASPDTTSPPPLTLPSTTAPSTSPTTTDVDNEMANVSPDDLDDELYPHIGNPGYDVRHYDVDLTYDTTLERLDAVVGIDLVALESRDEFTLDATFNGVSEVLVDGVPAAFTEDNPELRIPLEQTWNPGDDVRVEVTYSITPRLFDSLEGFPVGWFDTAGGSYVLNEPDGARSWLPSNDHPSDKATYRFVLRTPPGVTGVANGTLVEHVVGATGEVWVWDNPNPTATYLIQVLTGDYEVTETEGPNGVVLSHAVLRSDVSVMQPYIDITPEQIEFFSDLFGPYPFTVYGLAITDSFGGLAMETTGRSLYSREDFLEGRLSYFTDLLLSHELAHQWFGNSVTPARWKDIWLNESFATYSQWLWLDRQGYDSVQRSAEVALANRDSQATADPAVGELFSFNSYDGGAAVLHALRLTIGDEDFFALLKRWAVESAGTSRTTDEFLAMAEQVAGTDLDEFFATWLFAEDVPTAFPVGG